MKTSFRLTIVLMFFFTLLISCEPQKQQSKLLNEVITKDNLLDIAERAKTDKNFTKDEMELLATGVTRLAVTDTLTGKTIGWVIDNQKEYQREQYSERLNNNMSRVEIVMNHSFRFIELVPRDSLDIIVFEVTNKSDKDMVNIEGMLQFYNFQNQVIKQYALIAKHILNNEPIKAGETKRLAYPFKHDNENQRDNLMRQLRGQENLKPIWQPTTIEYVGGKILNVASQQR